MAPVRLAAGRAYNQRQLMRYRHRCCARDGRGRLSEEINEHRPDQSCVLIDQNSEDRAFINALLNLLPDISFISKKRLNAESLPHFDNEPADPVVGVIAHDGKDLETRCCGVRRAKLPIAQMTRDPDGAAVLLQNMAERIVTFSGEVVLELVGPIVLDVQDFKQRHSQVFERPQCHQARICVGAGKRSLKIADGAVPVAAGELEREPSQPCACVLRRRPGLSARPAFRVPQKPFANRT